MKTMRGLMAATAMSGALLGCAAVVPEPGSDAALCQLAGVQHMHGDPAWTATLERMSDRRSAWSCQNALERTTNGFLEDGGM